MVPRRTDGTGLATDEGMNATTQDKANAAAMKLIRSMGFKPTRAYATGPLNLTIRAEFATAEERDACMLVIGVAALKSAAVTVEQVIAGVGPRSGNPRMTVCLSPK